MQYNTIYQYILNIQATYYMQCNNIQYKIHGTICNIKIQNYTWAQSAYIAKES